MKILCIKNTIIDTLQLPRRSAYLQSAIFDPLAPGWGDRARRFVKGKLLGRGRGARQLIVYLGNRVYLGRRGRKLVSTT